MIPASVTTALTSLQTQVGAALPLNRASRATIIALQLNAAALVSSIDTAVAGAAGQLDTFTAPIDPAAIVSGILGLLTSAQDQSNLAVMRGVIGRVASNLDQLGPTPQAPGAQTPFVPLLPMPALPPAESGIGFLGKFAKTRQLSRLLWN